MSRCYMYIVNGDDHSPLLDIWRKSLRNALQEFGLNVMSFDVATALLHEMNLSSPAVLLLDIQRHDWGGIKLQAQLNEHQQHVPVVFLGCEANSKEIVLAMKQGAVDFLVKPFFLSARFVR